MDSKFLSYLVLFTIIAGGLAQFPSKIPFIPTQAPKSTTQGQNSPQVTSTTTNAPRNQSGDTCSCGQNRYANEKIVGGKEVREAEYPWNVALYSKSDNDNKVSFFCGSAIICGTTLMTAAHCTADYAKNNSGKTIYALAGYTDRTDIGIDKMIKVVKIVIHQNYSKNVQVQMEHDISLLMLERPLNYSDTIMPICLPYPYVDYDFKNVTSISTGWGATKPIGQISSPQEKMRSVLLPIITTDDCKNRTSVMPLRTGDHQICAEENEKGSCQGDSGGGLSMLDPTRKQHYAIGIVSWGIGCGVRGPPGVYTKVTHYLDWVKENTKGYCASFCGEPRGGFNTTTTTSTTRRPF